MSAILCQDNVTHALLHHGVAMAVKTNETMKVTSVQTLRQSHHHCSFNIYRCSSGSEARNG